MEYPGSDLTAMAQGGNYYRWILREFRPHLGRRILEVGAGSGTFAAHLLAEADPERAVLLEPATNLQPFLRGRFAGDSRVEVISLPLPAAQEALSTTPFDSVVSVNVLEHIPDDGEALAIMAGLLRSGGALLLFVPALPGLYGSLDAAFGHHRRYTRRELAGKLEAAGLGVRRIVYVNLPGALAWFVSGRILRWPTLRPGAVRLYDRLAIPLIAAVERRIRPPLGQSLLAVAEKG
jgi:SAM-dependent methyltransferase